MKLFCAIVGAARRAFSVRADESDSVCDLKKVIWEKMKAKFTDDDKFKGVVPSDLQLFLAKTEGGTWLTDDDQAALDLEDGKVHEDIQELIDGEKMKVTKTLQQWLFEKNKMPQPSTDQIHVLVVVPKIESKRPAEGELFSEVLKKLRAMESDVTAIKANVAVTNADLATTKADVAATNADVAATNKVLKLVTPKKLTNFKNLFVREDEFRLDSLSMTQQSDNPIIMTPNLHEFWKGFGEFPPYYFVRREEVMLWEVIKKQLFVNDRVVIVGSPGVGKSCLLMLIAFYLVCVEKRKVLIIRHLVVEQINALVYLDGKGSYARLLNPQPRDIVAIRWQITPESVEGEVVDEKEMPIVLLDGFTQDQVEDVDTGYGPFKFLATTCQFDLKQYDSSRVVVLPAWHDADLLQYAKLTNWAIETGLRTSKRQNTPLPKLVKEQYFYSGGSMRDFCKKRELLKMRVLNDCCSVGNARAFDLVYNYGGDQSRKQVDRLRRHYITDCQNEEHYYDCTCWKLSVDSGYVLSELGRIVDTDKQLEVYECAKSVGAGFHGVAYKLLLHNAVHGAVAKHKPIVLKMQEGSKYEKIEIRVPNVVCSGEDEASCYPCLSTLGKDTYWYPKYPFFPFIDAVTTCEAFRSGSEDSETIVAYVQVTIRSEKKFKEERLLRLNEEMDKNQSLKDMKRAFVVVGPDSDVCERFILHDAPDPDTFQAMICCFSPEQLEPEVSSVNLK